MNNGVSCFIRLHNSNKRVKVKVKAKVLWQPLMEVFHGTATECHLPYGITQCYLLPHTS